MTAEKLNAILAVGETVAVEFKRCGNGIGADTYESVCAFLNRFGGDVLLGVENDGTVTGIPEKAAPGMVKNFIATVGNPNIIHPTVYLAPEIMEYEGKYIIHIHVPPSSEVHSCKKVIYDRVDDADIKVTATGQIALLYIRKQNVYSERKVFKYVTDADLRLDMLPRLVQRAINHNLGAHPWAAMSVPEILKSARLITRDAESGVTGYNLAAVMLLGSDDVIKDICPTYRTDALLRKVNTNRYDDRLLVETNLPDSFDLLMGFVEKHLWDKFYLEGDTRMNLRNAIAREMLVNSLMHREFSSTYIAKLIIERDRMYTENANRAVSDGKITPENLDPNPKNPIIAAFFRNIGLADELGSGVMNLYKYGLIYSGKYPELIDGDVFRIIVPLDNRYSFDAWPNKVQDEAPNNVQYKVQYADSDDESCTLNDDFSGKPHNEAENKVQYKVHYKVQNANSKNESCTLNCTASEKAIMAYVVKHPAATQSAIAEVIGKSLRSVKADMMNLQTLGVLVREGARKNGRWRVKREPKA